MFTFDEFNRFKFHQRKYSSQNLINNILSKMKFQSKFRNNSNVKGSFVYLNTNNNNEENVASDERLDRIYSDDEDIGSFNIDTNNRRPLENLLTSNNASDAYYSKHPKINHTLIGNYTRNFNHFLNLTCGLIKNIGLLFLVMILVVLQKFINFFKYITKVDIRYKVPKALPKVLWQKVYGYCVRLVGGKVDRHQGSLGSQSKSSYQEDELIMTKWPLWTLFSVIILTFILGCYYGHPALTFSQKCDIGIDRMKWLFKMLYMNIYNLPGHECMILNNCCSNGFRVIRRWTYCLITLPFRTAFSGMEMDTTGVQPIEDILTNMTDWRLKRHLLKMKTKIRNAEIEAALIAKKANQYKTNMNKLTADMEKNFTTLDDFLKRQEAIEQHTDEILKEHEGVNTDIQSLGDVRQRIDGIVKESISCIKCTTKRTTMNSEKEANEFHSKVKGLSKRLEQIEKMSHQIQQTGNIGEAVKPYKDEINKMIKQTITEQGTISKLESFKFRFESDVKLIKQQISEKINGEILRYRESTKELINRVENIAHSTNVKIDQMYRNLKISSKQRVETYFSELYRLIKEEIMHDFCNQIKELVRLTVLNIISFSGNFRKCGVTKSGAAISDKQCTELISNKLITTFNHIDCCLTMDVVNQRIDNALETFDADQVGVVDFALNGNGGTIVETLTSPTLFVNLKDYDDEVLATKSPIWNNILNSNQHLLNSVFLLIHSTVQPGYCWHFVGSKGFTVIKLAQPVLIKMITIDHIDPRISITLDHSDAPKEFEIFALKSVEDKDEKSLGLFIFDDVKNFSTQHFVLEKPVKTQFLKISIYSNHGAEITCVYRLRVHGEL